MRVLRFYTAICLLLVKLFQDQKGEPTALAHRRLRLPRWISALAMLPARSLGCRCRSCPEGQFCFGGCFGSCPPQPSIDVFFELDHGLLEAGQLVVADGTNWVHFLHAIIAKSDLRCEVR
eukprot:TRINITY_DN66050_c0_g1_i1.p1 TRINITY_DN66050_c0_g1~~TRINITY_DN66050_c0_g1_i1.p1  ORF type:complete len:120 (-),score=14.74 TRINITY_DN66050_c0_g1_i1:26-385(-)